MSITLEFSPDIEAQLNERAKNKGINLPDLVRQMVEDGLAGKEIAALKTSDGHWDFSRLRALPQADQDRIMERAVNEAAPLYAADLALPPHERELTAFEAINDPIYDTVADYYVQDKENVAGRI